MSAILLETEKSYNLQSGQFFTMVFANPLFKINKIELSKLVKLCGLEVIKINSIQPYYKKKKRSQIGNNRKVVTSLVKRPRKFMIKLKIGQMLTQENMDFINTKLGLK